MANKLIQIQNKNTYLRIDKIVSISHNYTETNLDFHVIISTNYMNYAENYSTKEEMEARIQELIKLIEGEL